MLKELTLEVMDTIKVCWYFDSRIWHQSILTSHRVNASKTFIMIMLKLGGKYAYIDVAHVYFLLKFDVQQVISLFFNM